MRKLIFTLVLCFLISSSTSSQRSVPRTILTTKEKILLLEERIKNYENDLNRLRGELAKEEKLLKENFEIRNEMLENKARQVNWLFVVLGISVSLFGICLPVALIIISKKVHGIISRDRRHLQQSIYHIEKELYREIERRFRKYETILNKHQAVTITKEKEKEKEKTAANAHEDKFQFDKLITNFLNNPYPGNNSQNNTIISEMLSNTNGNIIEKELASVNELYNQKNYPVLINRGGDLLKKYGHSLSQNQLVFVHFQLAYAFHQTGDAENAIKFFSKVTALVPNNQYAHEIRGKGHAARGDYMNALSDFNRVLKLNPNSITAIQDRIEILLCLNNLLEIETQFKRIETFTVNESIKFNKVYLETVYSILSDKNTSGIDALFIRLKSSVNYKPESIERSLQVIKKALGSEHHAKTPRDKKEFITILIDKIEAWRGRK
jgi:tetratricopeptide (TPR) repeat protein